MGFKIFAEGDILTAEEVNDYLMRQTIISVANTTERDSIPAPQDGMQVYNRATKLVERYNGSAWVSGAVQVISSFGSGWAASTASLPVTVTKTADGMVSIFGGVRRTTALTATSASVFLFSVPAWARPSASVKALAHSNGTMSVAGSVLESRISEGMGGIEEVSVQTRTGTIAMSIGQEVYLNFTYRAA